MTENGDPNNGIKVLGTIKSIFINISLVVNLLLTSVFRPLPLSIYDGHFYEKKACVSVRRCYWGKQ